MTAKSRQKRPTELPPVAAIQRFETRRRAILDAALLLFATRGFHGTAVPLIADQAGVAAGTIYNYFASKEALVNVLYQECKSAFLAELKNGFPVDAAPRAQFHHVWQGLVRFHARAPLAFAFLELHFHAPYLDQASRDLEEAIEGFARQFFDAARAAGAVKDIDANMAIALVFGAFVNLTKQQSRGTVPDDSACNAQAEECLWNALRADTATNN